MADRCGLLSVSSAVNRREHGGLPVCDSLSGPVCCRREAAAIERMQVVKSSEIYWQTKVATRNVTPAVIVASCVGAPPSDHAEYRHALFCRICWVTVDTLCMSPTFQVKSVFAVGASRPRKT